MKYRFAFVSLLLLNACPPTSSETPGMSPTTKTAANGAGVGASVDEQGSIVVVYPRSPRTGSTRIVFLDDDRNFYGAVGPGEAAVLRIPPPRRTLMLHAISAVEIHAQPGTWFIVNDVIVSAPSGLLLDGYGGRSSQYPRIVLASRPQIEAVLADRGEREIQWLTTDRADGQRWIDEHKARVDELLARSTTVGTYRFSAGVTRIWTP